MNSTQQLQQRAVDNFNVAYNEKNPPENRFEKGFDDLWEAFTAIKRERDALKRQLKEIMEKAS